MTYAAVVRHPQQEERCVADWVRPTSTTGFVLCGACLHYGWLETRP